MGLSVGDGYHTMHMCACMCIDLGFAFCRLVMDKVKDLQDLIRLSEQELERLLENDSSAHLLWTFLHSDLETQIVTIALSKRN